VAQRWLLAIGVIFAMGAASAPGSEAATADGTVVAVVQSAEVDGQTGKLVLMPEAQIFSGDRIITGTVGQAQVKFRDETKLVVGPNSMLVVDEFVFSDGGDVRSFSINAVRGAFRFITGNGPKDAYTITTPTATIGVRGTEFDFNIDAVGATSVAVFEGTTRVCDKRRRTCVEQNAGCGIIAVAPGGDPRMVDEAFERARLQRDFRYIRTQRSLIAEFRVDVSSCRTIRADNQPSPSEPPTATASIVVPLDPVEPTPTVPSPNRSGLGDGTNPGRGAEHSRSNNSGSNNPGGS
jgi:hypothetical protein